MIENKIFISIIIPLYNKENYINRAIESVLNQDYTNFEIIIIDDGSTDNSETIVKKYSDVRIKYIKQKNQGVSSARNKGILNANYDYIAFLDADDEWLKNHLSDLEHMIKNFPNAGIYSKAYYNCDENGQIKHIWHNQNKIYEIDFFKETYLNKTYYVHTSATCISKKILNKYGSFKVGHPRGEDLDLWARIALYEKVYFYEKESSIYYLNTENNSREKVYIEEYPFLEKFKELSPNDKNILTKFLYIQEFVAMQQFLRIKVYILSNQSKKARNVLYETKTKIQKKKWIILYIMTFIPYKLLQYLKNKRI
jgi:glycosyltransferase involved in cell wall biosynthesis